MKTLADQRIAAEGADILVRTEIKSTYIGGSHMCALFGKSEEKVAREEAVKAEAERLVALPPAELAVEVLPAFAGENVKRHVHSSLMASKWLMSSFPKGTRYPVRELDPPVRAALQVLLNAGLLMERAQPGRPPQMYITPLGETALAEGDVRRYLD